MKNKKMRALQHAHKSRLFTIANILFAFVIFFVFSSFVNELIGMASGGFSLATMAAIGNIDGLSDRFSAGAQISAKLWLIHVDSQLDTSAPFPKPNLNREMGTIPLKPGERMHYFTAIDDTINDNSKGDKGDITTNVTNTLGFTMGGNRDNLLNFIEEYAGGRFILIYQICSEGVYYVMGTPCKPMVFKSFDRKNDKDSRSIQFTFENKGFNQPYKYRGEIIQGAPGVIATGSTTFTIQHDKGIYHTPSNNTSSIVLDAVSGLSNPDKGRIIDIIGTGGEFPLIIEHNDHFLLIDQETWTANTGSRISFRVLDTSTIVEVENSRVQS